MTPDRLNVAAEGARSQGTIVRAGCWRCGEEVSVRVPAVEVHQLNHERERAEKAEAAARDFAEAMERVADGLARVAKQAPYEVRSLYRNPERKLRDALAAHPAFAQDRKENSDGS